MNTVLASMSIDFLSETRFPGEVDVGAGLVRIGNRSLRSVYGVFRDGECLATSRCVNVYFDMRSRRSTAPTDAVRKIMKKDLVCVTVASIFRTEDIGLGMGRQGSGT